MAINYRTRFAHRIDLWDADGENVVEHLAGVEDPQVAMATYVAACQRWPGATPDSACVSTAWHAAGLFFWKSSRVHSIGSIIEGIVRAGERHTTAGSLVR